MSEARLFKCQSCGGRASHFLRMSLRRDKSKRGRGKGMGNGYRICVECIELWSRYGRTGLAKAIGADGEPA